MKKTKKIKLSPAKILVRCAFLAMGLAIIVVFFSAMEEYEVLIAGTATDTITVSVTVLEAISISSPSDVSMSPDIAGTGSSTGEADWTVTTNWADGWKLEVQASTTPAMQSSGDSFADYTEATPDTPETWSVDGADSEFGFSASGIYAESEYSSGTKFQGFEGSTKKQVAHKDSPSASGDATTVNFKAEVGASHSQTADDYEAIITATASTL
jgi:hypothetical protein